MTRRRPWPFAAGTGNLAMLNEAKTQGVKKAAVHILLDGRDVPPTSALEYVDRLEEFLSALNAGSDIDFASGYLTHVLGFIGIEDVSIISAERFNQDDEQGIQNIRAQIQDVSRQAA